MWYLLKSITLRNSSSRCQMISGRIVFVAFNFFFLPTNTDKMWALEKKILSKLVSLTFEYQRRRIPFQKLVKQEQSRPSLKAAVSSSQSCLVTTASTEISRRFYNVMVNTRQLSITKVQFKMYEIEIQSDDSMKFRGLITAKISNQQLRQTGRFLQLSLHNIKGYSL